MTYICLWESMASQFWWETMITIVIRTEESVVGARLSIFVLFLVFHKQTTFDMYVFTTPPTVSKSATVTSDTADDTNWSRQWVSIIQISAWAWKRTIYIYIDICRQGAHNVYNTYFLEASWIDERMASTRALHRHREHIREHYHDIHLHMVTNSVHFGLYIYI